jgi:hypothetical protein
MLDIYASKDFCAYRIPALGPHTRPVTGDWLSALRSLITKIIKVVVDGRMEALPSTGDAVTGTEVGTLGKRICRTQEQAVGGSVIYTHGSVAHRG